MLLSGTVIRGRGYDLKPVSTANINLNSPMGVGMYVAEIYFGGPSSTDKLGDAFIFVSEHAPNIAEAYITGYSGDLYGQTLTISDPEKLDDGDMRFLYDSAMESWRLKNVPVLS